MANSPTGAREQAGLTVLQASRRLNVSHGYLRRLERSGGWSLFLAERAARLYGCRLEIFLFVRKGNETKSKRADLRL